MNRKPTTHDAIIIGGGPAGAMAALLLSRQGWRVALVERRSRHQPKACGHCLDARANRVLERAGLLADVQAVAGGTVQCATIHVPAAGSLRWAMGGGSGEPSLVVRRSQLDQLLMDRAQQAGVDLFQPASAHVRSLAPGRCAVRVLDRTLHAPLLIGADGLRSRVAQMAALGEGHDVGRKYGFSFDLPADGRASLERGVTHMFVIHGGYLGIVHGEPDLLHLAALVSGEHRQSPAAFINRVCVAFAQLGALDAHDMRSFVAAGPMPSRAADVASESVALIGDAAGYVEPFTGEGMMWAMQSAELLAQVTGRIAPGQWTARQAMAYRRRWRQHIARRQRFCRALSWALERPRLMRPLMTFTHRMPRLARRMAQQVLAA